MTTFWFIKNILLESSEICSVDEPVLVYVRNYGFEKISVSQSFNIKRLRQTELIKELLC